MCCRSEGGNHRVTPAEEDHDFCFFSVELEPLETCIVIFVHFLLKMQWSSTNKLVYLSICVVPLDYGQSHGQSTGKKAVNLVLYI